MSIIRIGVFIDGGYFSHVSNYYMYQHKAASRINLSGLHRFIAAEAAQHNADGHDYQIVDSHYFRGRLSAGEAEDRGILASERRFEDVLIAEGVTPHYLPVGRHGEKGIDVALTAEALDQALSGRFDVCALVAGDGDFVPLARKLNAHGVRVMALGWSFSYERDDGMLHETRVSHRLMQSVTYPVYMHDVIARMLADDAVPNDLFLRDVTLDTRPGVDAAAHACGSDVAVVCRGETGTLGNLFPDRFYGFIETADSDLFFHFSALPPDTDLSRLSRGQSVTFDVGDNDRGPCAINVVLDDLPVEA